MKNLGLIALLCFAFTLQAQDRDEDSWWEEDEEYYQEKQKKKKDRDTRQMKTLSSYGHNGGFFGFTFKTTEFNEETVVSAGFRTGWIVSRAVGIGFEAHGLIPTAKFDNIAPPERAVLLGGYGGMFIEPILFSNEIVHLTFPVAAGAGWFGYHQDWEQDYVSYELLYDDIYWYLEPGVSVEVNVAKNFRIAVGASQRFTQELELFNTPSGAFDNRNYFLTMKFGRF